MNKAELLEQMRAGRQRLDAALARVADDRWTTPELPGRWSIKDLLAHLGWWEGWIVGIYATLLRGEAPYARPLDQETVDDLNAQALAKYHDQPLAEVRRQEEDAYRNLLAVVEKAPEEDLLDPHRFAWLQGQTLAEWIINNAYGHYDEHLADVLRWLG
jgi:uncharacterized protein (TIGR03083 family)